MAEIPFDVYDVLYPSPVPLKELTAIAISIDIWRNEVDKYRKNCKLKEFQACDGKLISPKTILPDLPSVFYDMIEEKIKIFGLSVKSWLTEHFEKVFLSHGFENQILEYFDDFAGDFGGAINYVRTAERMMLCDRLDDAAKLQIACWYCFEDDILRIWPTVPERIQYVNFYNSPQLHYWDHCLQNKSDSTLTRTNAHSDEVMFFVTFSYNRSSVEYFWNRLPYEMKMNANIFTMHIDNFVRFILHKLDEQQVQDFVDVAGHLIMHDLLTSSYWDEKLILPAWMRLKNAMKENDFIKLIIRRLRREDEHDAIKNRLHIYRDIWNSAPSDLKRKAIREISSNDELFKSDGSKDDVTFDRFDRSYAEFLLDILQCASVEERNAFWRNCWHHLILRVCGRDLRRVIVLCFENDHRMIHFKENVMAESKNVRNFCTSLLHGTNFDELNDFVDLLWFEKQAARNYKQKLLQELLQSSFIVEDCFYIYELLCSSEKFIGFINDAYGSADLSADFKNQLLSSPPVQELIKGCFHLVFSVPLKELMEFFEAFVATEHALGEVKMRLSDFVRRYVTGDKRTHDIFDLPSFDEFLLWCLGSEEEVLKFKLTHSRV